MFNSAHDDTSKQNYTAVTRAYLLDLKAGKKPDIRPEVGEWLSLVTQLEEKYAKVKGNPAAMEQVFAFYEQQYPALADLLASSPARITEVRELGMPALPEAAQLPRDLSRGACPELDIYEVFSREASPEGWDDFHVFGGMWLFSAVAARRVYLPLKRKKVFTNLMIAWCSETSMFAKSTTADVAKDVLRACGLGYLLGPNRITPQKLWSDMAGSHVPEKYDELDERKQERQRRKLGMPGQKCLYFDEFGKFIQGVFRKNSHMVDFADMFLEFDACPENYENATISRGGEPIENPYIALLGSMTPTNMKDVARAGADGWGDGLLARFSFIAAPPATEDTVKDCALEPDELDIPEELTEALKAWHERLGVPESEIIPVLDKKGESTGKYEVLRADLPETACAIAPEAFQAWRTYRSALKHMCIAFPHKDFHGSYARLPETAMRMAVIMASLSNNNRIELRHWAKAQELAEILRRNLHELYTQVNMPVMQESQGASIEDEICKHLGKHGPMTLAKLRFSFMKSTSVKQLEEAIRGLKRAGLVEEFATPHAKAKYRLIEQTETEEEPIDE